jgi:hypothetical protein
MNPIVVSVALGRRFWRQRCCGAVLFDNVKLGIYGGLLSAASLISKCKFKESIGLRVVDSCTSTQLTTGCYVINASLAQLKGPLDQRQDRSTSLTMGEI